jgi:hypothetical protein
MDPKKSTIDIAQAIGRAMRKPRGSSSKKIGYIFIPLLVESTDGKMTESSIEETDYKAIADVINAMQELDEDLKDIISEIRFQTGLTGQFNPRKLSEKISFSGNLNELSLKVIEKAVLNNVVDRIGESWDESFGKLQAYVKKHQAYPAPRSGSLGMWVAVQRSAYNKKTLSPDRVQRLESLKGWSWDPRAERWNELFQQLQAYLKKHKTYPGWDSGSLATWLFHQRTLYKKKILSQDQIRRLESLPGWSWDPLTGMWGKTYQQLKDYVKKNQAYPSAGSGRLASWLSNQRTGYKKKILSQDQIRRLESLPGWSWDPFADKWDKAYRQSQAYLKKYRSYPSQDSTGPGRWLTKQRILYKKKILSQDEIRRLESLPNWSWDVRTDLWDKTYQQLKDYVKKNQTYPVVSSGRLGRWLNTQRTAYKKNEMSQDRIRRLESLPNWSWGQKKKN